MTGRRRNGNVHAVVASTLAVLALVGCVIAILMLATQPTAARLESEVASLNHRLGATRGQLVKLQTALGHITSREPTLTTDLHRLGGRVAGLGRTVHGLQSNASLTQEQAAALHDCVPEVQRELAGLAVKTRSVNGRVISVGLSDSALVSPSCEALLSGL